MNTNNSTVSREIFDGFPGMDVSTARGKNSCRLENFRVKSDGSLEKREGFRLLASLGVPVRGVSSFPDGDGEVILAVAGNSLARITPAGAVTSAEAFGTTTGKVGFFRYGGKLYILDGNGLYRYDGGCTASEVFGYTPLYGKNWSPDGDTANTVNEPMNLASPRIRIHYVVGEATDTLVVGMAIHSVEWVATGSAHMEAQSYSVSADGKSIVFTDTLSDCELTVCVTPQVCYPRNTAFAGLTSGAVFEDFAQSRVFLYGGSQPGRMIVSVEPGTEALAQDAACFTDTCGLYFPANQSLSFGNGQEITAVCRLYDRMTVMFPDSVWVTQKLDSVVGSDFRFLPICNHMGCSAPGAMLLTGAASPVTVSESGIYGWKIDPEFVDECVCKRLSEPIAPMLDSGFFANAKVCHNRGRDEIWFRDPADTAGRVWILDIDSGKWVLYSGVPADELFSFDGTVGFTDGGNVCLFDEAETVDHKVSGTESITATYESGYLDFGEPGSRKRLAGITVSADLDGGQLTAKLYDGGGRFWESDRIEEPEDAFMTGIYELRGFSGQFLHARLTLCAPGAARQRIYRAEIKAQKGKS